MAGGFDNTNKWLSRTTGTILDYNSPYTVALWFRYVVSNDKRPSVFLAARGVFDNPDRLKPDWFNGVAQVEVNGTDAAGSTAMTNNTWFWLTYRRTGAAAVQLYVNNVLEATNTVDTTGRAAALQMAVSGYADGTEAANNFEVAYIKAWSASLTTTQMSDQQYLTTPITTTGLFGDWRLQTGALGTDSSSNGYDFTVNGALAYVSDPAGVNPPAGGSGYITTNTGYWGTP